MADSDSPPPEDASRCGVHEEARRGCAGLPTYHRVDGTPYCVLHAPRPDKMAAFQRALSEKLERRDWNFAAVWFPADQSFYKVEFGVADFSFATFNGNARFSSASFGRVEFGRTVFKANAFFGWEVSFRSDATFFETVFEGEADFGSAHFKGAYFHGTRFARHASFHSAVFDEMAAFSATFEGDVDFSLARFARRGTFRDSRFAGGVRFFGNDAYPVFLPESVMSFADTRFAKPELVSFENVTLRPHWFVGADAKAIVFTNVEWRGTLVDEINGARAALAQAPHRVVEQACNRLAVNAENNQRYDEASRFRYWAMDARRRERARGWAFWRLDWWYWLASGYGERAPRALVVLVALWLAFGVAYTRVEFRGPQSAAAGAPAAVVHLDLPAALVHSLGVLSLQRPDPPAASLAGRALVLVETVIAPLQAALLALAVRRKFMR